MDTNFIETMELIVASIREAGFEPYDQLYGYVDKGDPIYITRQGNARELIQKLDKGDIARYIKNLNKTDR